MSVYVERRGRGPDLVLLHGWGMNGAVWQGLAPRLEADFRLHLVDLPVFGHSRALPAHAG
ncbi:MAG: alpha/beta fold hydrolase, partial [Oceanisphaera sp.]|nr:alpha/beta fold hydrolase [Oceanisphaera sp.]